MLWWRVTERDGDLMCSFISLLYHQTKQIFVRHVPYMNIIIFSTQVISDQNVYLDSNANSCTKKYT